MCEEGRVGDKDPDKETMILWGSLYFSYDILILVVDRYNSTYLWQ